MSSTLQIVAYTVAVLATAFSGFLVYEYMLEFDTPDPYSYTNASQLKTDHFDLRMELDFDKKVIKGEQKLKMTTQSMFVMEAILDIKDIDVHEVLYEGEPTTFKITRTKPEVGQALRARIPLQLLPSNTFELTVKYTTSPSASALSWMFANQTRSGTMPYLFSQCETAHCRSIAPFQDTPAIKSTFNVHILSPKDMIVRASGNKTQEFDYDNHRSTKFESQVPVPSYLFAIVAGDLAEQKIGTKTYVITEKSYLSEAASRISELEKGLNATIEYLTPYVWGDYKIVIQPPSFPYGGMENPMLSFTSSTLVQGDATNAVNAYHEIAHSWAGNLVTHDSWSNVWIKEAFATFVERKVTKQMRGETAYKISSQRGKESMLEAISILGETNPLTSLNPPETSASHPDAILNAVQAEKGYQMLVYIEQLVGDNFMEEFIIDFFKTFEYQSINTADFEDYLIKFVYKKFESATAREILSSINFDSWINQPGLPPVEIDFSTPEYISAIAMAEEYIINDGGKTPDNYRDWESYSVDLKYLFLDHFLKNTTRLSYDIVSRIDSNHDLYYLTNPDLITLFMEIAVAGEYYTQPFRYPSEFVAAVGRIDNVAPIYYQIAQKSEFHAQEIFKQNEYFYHPIARQEIKKIVGL